MSADEETPMVDGTAARATTPGTDKVTPMRRRSQREVTLPENFDIARDPVPAGTDLYRDILRYRIKNTSYYVHPERVQLYQLRSKPAAAAGLDVEVDGVPDPDGEDGPRLYYMEPVNLWGCPKLLGTVNYGKDDASPGMRTRYEIEVDGVAHVVSWQELHDGTCWENWLGLGIASRRDINDYVSVVDQQVRLFGPLPQHQGRRATGWTLHEGQHVLVLPDGKMYGAHGEITGVKAYIDLAMHHQTPYAGPMAIDRSKEAQAAALAFHAGVARRSLGGLILCAHLDSIMYGVLRSDYAVIVRGETGRGKTGLVNEGRNTTGVFPFGTPATVSFKPVGSTISSIEKHLHQIKHLPMLLDDFLRTVKGDDAEGTRKWEMVIRSLSNNEPVRFRQSKNMETQPANTIDGVPILTCENIPQDINPSLVQRTVLLDVRNSDIDRDLLKRHAESTHAGLRGLGHGFIQYLAAQWDGQGDALAEGWREWHRAMCDRITLNLETIRGGRLPDNATRLPSNAAHLLLAAKVLTDYCTAAGIPCDITPEALYTDLLTHLLEQMDTIATLETGGNDGVPLGDWVAEQVHAALGAGRASVRMQDGSMPPTDGRISPDDLGWRPRGSILDGQNVSDLYQPMTPWLGVLDLSGEYVCCYPEHLHNLLKSAAARDRRRWQIARNGLGKALVDAGLVLPDPKGKSTRTTKVNGHPTRLLWIPAVRIWPHLAEDDTPDGDGTDGADNTGTGAHQDTQEAQDTREGAITPDTYAGTPAEPLDAPNVAPEPMDPPTYTLEPWYDATRPDSPVSQAIAWAVEPADIPTLGGPWLDSAQLQHAFRTGGVVVRLSGGRALAPRQFTVQLRQLYLERQYGKIRALATYLKVDAARVVPQSAMVEVPA